MPICEASTIAREQELDVSISPFLSRSSFYHPPFLSFFLSFFSLPPFPASLPFLPSLPPFPPFPASLPFLSSFLPFHTSLLAPRASPFQLALSLLSLLSPAQVYRRLDVRRVREMIKECKPLKVVCS